MAFQAFPLGNALLFQGNILVVETVLGSVAVVLFSTARTLVRSVNQTMEMVNQIVSPEFSILFGKNDFPNARRLHRLSVLASFSFAVFFTVILIFAGIPLYTFWTGKVLVLSETTLMFFLLPIPFNALWYTSSVVHAACNRHESLAIRYLFACTISLGSCFLLSKLFGIQGAAVSTIFADLLLIRFVILRSLALTNDNLGDFLKNSVIESKTYVNFFLKKIRILN